MSEVFVYVTCPSVREAEDIGRVIVKRRLVACVNIIRGMTSMYWWQGKVESAQEVVLIAKTVDNKMEELTTAIVAMHPYDTPCVVSFPLTGGSDTFLEWIRQETGL